MRGSRDVPCADCGCRLPPEAMEFDHWDPSQKTCRLTGMVGRSHLRGDREMRYRLSQLAPRADTSSVRAAAECGSSSVGGARVFQTRGRGFEPRLPL